MRWRVLAMVLVATVLSAIFVVPADAAPGPALAWRPCGNGAECTTLRVPLDWSRPGGTDIELALSRVRAADPGKRAGSLLINPGGPGGQGAAVVEWNASVFPQQLRDEFDLVGFDPRGVGASSPAITCDQPVFDPAVTQFPRTQAEFDRLVAHNRAAGLDCLRGTGPLLAHVDTVSVARDMDAIRAALGERTLNYFGLSYGTLIGGIYASLYPQRVRAMVLDGPVDHTVGTRRLAEDENVATEASLQHFFTWCDQRSDCALHDAEATYRALLRKAGQAPLPAKGIPGGVTAEVAAMGVYDLLTVTAARPDLATAIQQAANGDATALADAAPNGPDSTDNPFNTTAAKAYLSITCQDFPSDVTSFVQLRQRMSWARLAAPDVAGHLEGWLIQAGCVGWPVPAADPWQPVAVHGTPPILVVGGRYDPATPYPWAVGLARQIAGSVLLTRSSDGHTGLLNDACARQREVAYLTDPAAPVAPCP